MTQGALNIAVDAYFASMHATAEIQKHGEKAVAMIIKELKQLNFMKQTYNNANQSLMKYF